jgi:hypothetical protein
MTPARKAARSLLAGGAELVVVTEILGAMVGAKKIGADGTNGGGIR